MSVTVHLPPSPTDESQQQLENVSKALAKLEHLPATTVSDPSKNIAAILERYLNISGHRTLIMLDNGGVDRKNVAAILGTLASYGTTTVVSVSAHGPVEYGSAAENIAIEGGPEALLAHIRQQSGDSQLKGVADVVCGYHNGEGSDASLFLADHLLTNGGLYVEIFYNFFTQADEVILYRREELADIVQSRAARAAQQQTGALSD